MARFESFVVFFARLEAHRERQHIKRIGEANRLIPCPPSIADVEASSRNAERLAKGANG